MKELIELFAEKVGRYPRGNVQDELRSWAANEITTLRQQLADAKKENERVRQANLDVMMHFEDMKAAKEKAEARVAELEADNEHQRERRNAARECIKKMGDGSPWLLRKQAEAVDVLAKRLQDAADKADEGPDESDTACTLIIAKSVARKEAQRLRQQADETERAGGEQ